MIAALALLALLPTADVRPVRVAVPTFAADGIDEAMAKVVSAAVVAELRKLRATSVVDYAELQAMLEMEADKQIAGCNSEDSCLGEIAAALGADELVVGRISVVGDERVFDMRRIDQAQAKTLGQVVLHLEDARGEELLAAVGPAVEQLFPDRPLRPGAHRGVDPAFALRLNPPPLPPWVLVATGAVTAAVVVADSAVIAANVGAAQALEQRYASGAELDGKSVVADERFVNDTFTAAVVLSSVAVVGGLACGALALFTDFAGRPLDE